MIPEESIDEASEAIRDGLDRLSIWDLAKAALEAALPTLLSHEREETRLAHLDAVVNAESLSKYETAIDKVLELVDSNDMNGVVIVSAKRIRAAIDEALEVGE